MKKLTLEQVLKALVDNQSVEIENGYVEYYLHINENGEIVTSFRDAEISFTHKVDTDEIDGWDEADDMDVIYNQENMETPWFADAVQDLTEQANEWIEENE
ncbi:MAG: hypothetical protein KHY89_10535 [Butyricicoccus pullicaecorum]|nr:hypothetical protein [Butyricicoccus pullicaecorum]